MRSTKPINRYVVDSTLARMLDWAIRNAHVETVNSTV